MANNANELAVLIDSLQLQLKSKDQTIALLIEQVRILKHKHFGRSSEHLSPDQIALLFNEAESAIAQTVSPTVSQEITYTVTRKKHSGRRFLPPALPRVIVNHDLPESEKVCPRDGTPLHRVGEVVSEQLDIVPMRIQVIRHVRHSYGCRCCGETIKTASLPPQPIPQSIASPGTLAHLAVAKYAEHLPLYRQEQILKRHGLDITRATLAQWMMDLGTLITPLINLLQDRLVEGPLIQMDETPVQVLQEVGKPATSQSYMWVRRGGPPNHPIILFDYHPSRSGRVARDLLEGYSGILQTDGYGGYDAFGHYPDIVHAGCLAHYLERRFIWSQPLVSSLTPLRWVQWTPHNSCRSVEVHRRVGEQPCRSRCIRSRVPKCTSPDASGVMPACSRAPCILRAAAPSPAMAAMRV